MSTKVNTAITPSLHPDVVKSIDGYDEDTAAVLGPTGTAFSTAYNALGDLQAARKDGEKNQAWTPEILTIKLDDLASKKMNHITRTFDAEIERLNKGIHFLETELSQPVESQAVGSMAAEIRAYAKSLQTGELMTFIQQAIEDGDTLTVSSVLGGPAYLSGLDPKLSAVLLRQYHAKHNPEKAKRLKVMQGARDLIYANAGKVFPAMVKIVGAHPDKAKKLRDANTAAEKHFAMHGS